MTMYLAYLIFLLVWPPHHSVTRDGLLIRTPTACLTEYSQAVGACEIAWPDKESTGYAVCMALADGVYEGCMATAEWN
jgi:hypothetical protein